MNKLLLILKVLAISIILPACLSCSKEDNKETYYADFSYDVQDNQVIFTNASTGDYLYVEWDFGNDESTGKSADKSKVHTIYFPLKGEYEVTLKLWGNLNTESDTKTVTKTISIDADDPDYVNPEGLIWSDEFNSATINTANWKFEVGTGDNGWGNNELQYYTNGDNAKVVDGKLILTAKKVNDDKVQGSYTSTRMISWGKKEFTYGRIEVRAKLPSGTGVWPAIWMLGANLGQVGWPACGEIDIMEYVGYQPDVVHATVHTPAGYAGDGNGSSKSLPTCEEEFHIYGLLWTETSMTFYVDSPDNVVHVYAPAEKNDANWPFNKPHFFILNVAVGGNWGGAQGIDNAIFPQSMEVDYVRVYELN
ncbi:family 16 glycosylhydrolase [Carboxylicivirga sediminis]|uniref:Family 16 glycosylhydrolase n=1 Tax=Carboxylicivirga sediminis TaxID=2006564 RepID=A0A941IV27_9BACT|nr:family 16 glycosylhydrolase [Carboxylicivirga sediminis]MBR8534465.1 family 16 glycosylhydrolase [Carboxylicivirga sediminis]